MAIVCGCGKGHASVEDGICKYCREGKYRRAQAKWAGVRHRGDGMSLEEEARIKRGTYWPST